MRSSVALAILITLLTGAQLLLVLQQLPNSAALAAQHSVTDFVYGGCNTANVSTYAFSQNLVQVVTSLKGNASQFMYKLVSSEAGGSQSNYVYGIYQCRGDVSQSVCSSCVRNGLSTSASDSFPALSMCGSLPRGLRVQYEGCYIRYENYLFYTGFIPPGGAFYVPPSCTGSSNLSSPLYRQNLGSVLQASAAAAPRHSLFGYNATTVGSGSNRAYALTQCLGYLNSSECAACLSQVSNYSNACNRSVSGSVYFESCYYLFSNTSLVFTYPPSTALIPPQEAPTVSASSPSPEKNKNHTAATAGIVVGVCVLLAIAVAIYFLKRQKKSGAAIYKPEDPPALKAGQQLLAKHGARKFSLKELQDATCNFHINNKLGQGGFGPVYQGRLKCGMEVAIKMLSAQSHQGMTEFINEVNLITTVQHRNLIKLTGYCIDNNQHLLVYEYLTNRSLDIHLFG